MTLTAGWSADDTGLIVIPLDRPAGLRLCGQVDMLSTEALRAAIAALPADTREVHFELAELSFADVGGTRELLALARRPAQPHLILHRPPRSLVVLIHLLWPDCTQAPLPSDHREDRAAMVSILSA